MKHRKILLLNIREHLAVLSDITGVRTHSYSISAASPQTAAKCPQNVRSGLFENETLCLLDKKHCFLVGLLNKF